MGSNLKEIPDPNFSFGVGNVFLTRETPGPARMAVKIYMVVDGEETSQVMTVTESKAFLRGFVKSIRRAENLNKYGH